MERQNLNAFVHPICKYRSEKPLERESSKPLIQTKVKDVKNMPTIQHTEIQRTMIRYAIKVNLQKYFCIGNDAKK